MLSHNTATMGSQKKLSKTALSIAVVFLFLSGSACTTTRMTAKKAPTQTRGPYKTLLLIAGSELRTQEKATEALRKALMGKSSAKVISIYDIFFPKTDYAKQEVRRIVKENEIDAVVVVNVGGQQAVNSGFLIPVFETSEGSMHGTVRGKVGSTPVYGDVDMKTEEVRQGSMWYPYTVIYTDSNMSLYDLTTAEIVWHGSATTESLDLGSVISSIVHKGARELLKEGLIAPLSR